MDTSNQGDKNHDKEQANKDASEKMAQNQDLQDAIYQKTQNEQDGTTAETEHMLENSGNTPDDALTLEQQNKNKLKQERDEDFGGEQLQ